MLSACGELPFLYPPDPGDAGACGLNMTAMGVPAVGLVTGQVMAQAHGLESPFERRSPTVRATSKFVVTFSQPF